FQAEDGIRDKLVTGVQTCALPIWQREREGLLLLARERHRAEVVAVEIDRGRMRAVGPALDRDLERGVAAVRRVEVADVELLRRRSEERRVGKEGRSRGAGEH